MVQAAGLGQVASPVSNTLSWKPSLRLNGYRCSPSGVIIHQQLHNSKGVVPLTLTSPLCPNIARSGSRCSGVRSAGGHAESGLGAETGFPPPPEPGGSKQWSDSWASVTGSYRGSYEEVPWGLPEAAVEGFEDKALRSRTGKLLALGGAVMLELMLTGALVWTPLAAAAAALLVLPGARALTAMQAAAREAEAVARAEARVRAEMAARVPVSPPESAVWMSRLMGELWQPFVQPLVLGDNLGHWADKVRRAAPAGLELQLEEMNLGREAPQMSNFQVLAEPASGKVTAIDCDMSYDSSSMRVVVSGSGPLGRFTGTMTGINMRGRMRLVPIPDQRMILFAFREPPTIDPKLTIEGPFLGARDIPPTSALRSLLAAALQDCLVEPVRGAISLDPEPLVGQPVDTTINIYVESVYPGVGAGVTHTAYTGSASAAAASPSAGGRTPSTSASSSHTDPKEPQGTSPPGSQEQSFFSHQRTSQPPDQDDDSSVAAFLASLVSEASTQPTSIGPGGPGGGGGGSGGGGSSATAAVVAAASNAAAAAGEAVAEGAGAIASLVPGLSAVAGTGSASEVSGRGGRPRLLQIVAINTDNKLQRETRPVPYTSYTSGSANTAREALGSAAAASGASASSPSASTVAAASEAVVPVLQMLKLNVGHKDTIYKILVKDVGRNGGRVGSMAAGVGSGTTAAAGSAAPPSLQAAAPSSSSSAGATSASSSSLGSTSAASSTPTSVAAAVVSGLPTPGLLGSVRLHVAAAKDGSTLFWAAGPGGEPVAVRWRPSDSPWRVTLPLESPTYGLPPPAQSLPGGSGGGGGPTAASQAGRDAAVPLAATAPTVGGVSGVSGGGGGSNKDKSQGMINGSTNGNIYDSSSHKRRGGGSSGKAADRAHRGTTMASSHPNDGTATSVDPNYPTAKPAAAGVSRGGRGISSANADSDATAGSHLHSASWGSSAPPGAPEPTSSASSGSGHQVGPGAMIPTGAPSITLLVSADPWVYKDARAPGSLYESPRPGSIVLQVVEARDLAAHDWAGTCDPYVRISYDGRTYRTRTLYNAHRPVWQQTFILPDNRASLSPTSPPRNRLSLSMYDSGVSRDDPLGSASLNLDGASVQQLQDQWIPLQGVESGWIRVRLAAVPDSPDSAAVQRVVEALERLTRGSEPLLQVVVLSARALSPRRGAQLLGLRDAYCNIVYGGARHVTPVVRQSQNPRWDYSALFVMQYDEDVETQSEDEGPHQNRVSGELPERHPGGRAWATKPGSNGGVAGSSRADSGGNGTSHSSEGPDTADRQSVNDTTTTTSAGQRREMPRGYAGSDGGSAPLAPDAAEEREAPKASSPQGSGGGAAARLRPRPRFRRGFNRDLLRLEIKDVAPVPPDEDLGWVELPVRAVLPQLGDSWQGWLPLRRGEGAELLVQINRIETLPLGQGKLQTLPPPPQQQQDPLPTMGGVSAAAAGGAATSAYRPSRVAASGVTGSRSSSELGLGVEGPSLQQGGAALVERVLMDNFTDQVRAANRAASQVGQDLRVRLGQDVIPKLQDWWEGTLQRTASSLEQPATRISTWLRNPRLLSTPWTSGMKALPGEPLAERRKMLPGPASSRGSWSSVSARGLKLKASDEDKQTEGTRQEGKELPGSISPDSEGAGVSDQGSLAGGRQYERTPTADGGLGGEGQTRSSTGSSSSTTATAIGSTTADAETAGGSNVASVSGRRNGVLGKAAKGGEGRSGNGKGGVPRATDGGGLGQLLSRTWEHLLGPPAYQPKPRTDDSAVPQHSVEQEGLEQEEDQQDKK